MVKGISRIKIAAIVSFAMIGGVFAIMAPTFAADPTSSNIKQICDANPSASICSDLETTNDTRINSTFQGIVNILLYIIGIVAVIMIIISGIRMITSRGEPNVVTSARNTLLYSIVGLVIAVVAFAIVNFVLGRL